MKFEAVIGLEVHAELNTETKMYCACKNEFGGAPNIRVCPVCTGMPGALPRLNRAAVEKAIRAGRMMHCEIAQRTWQDRKHYRYPDLPKGYQISQFSHPMCQNGFFDFYEGDTLHRARIRQIHIEEDAGKLVHEDGKTFVDYNRCGVPLIEIVTEPCFHSADEAIAFMEAVRVMLLDLGVSDCRMEEGSMRADVNVSLRQRGDQTLAPRVEMKNLSSFSGARRAILYEIERQRSILQEGGQVIPLTRRWDDARACGVTMRAKERAQDYRFLPEPDIPLLFITEDTAPLPESEAERRLRLLNRAGLSPQQAREIAHSRVATAFLDETVACGARPEGAANWLLGTVAQLCNAAECALSDSALVPQRLAEVLCAIDAGTITADGGKRAVAALFKRDEPLDALIERLQLKVLSDEQIYRETIAQVLAGTPRAVADFRAGKKNALGFLIGQCMRRAGAAADASRFRALILEALEGK